MKKKTILQGVICILLLLAAFPLFTSSLTIASASGVAQDVTPPAATVVPGTQAPAPGTESSPSFFLPTWVILVLVGLVGLLLLLALLRPVFVTTTTPTHTHTTHTHDHNP